MSAAAVLKNEKYDVKSMLQSCLLFQEAAPEAIDFVAQHSEAVAFSKGDCIILENEANNFVYFIAQGSVEIVKYLAGDNRVQRLALLKAGSNFAEFSILTNLARSGSAYAFEDCVLIRMDGTGFLSLLKTHPAISLRLVKHLADINQSIESFDERVPFYHPSQLSISQQVLQYLPLAVCQKLGVIPVSYKAGLLTVLIKNPHNKDFYDYINRSLPKTEVAIYLISESEFEAAFQTVQKSLKLTLVPSGHQTVECKTELDVLASFKGSPLFGRIKDEVLNQMIQHVTPIHLKAGTHAFQPGNKLEAYYLVAEGRVQINRPLSQSQAVAPLMTLSPGDGFGEVQMITGEACGYSLRVLEDTTLLPVPNSIMQQFLKSPAFAVSIAKALAKRLQLMGQIEGFQYFKTKNALDFKSVANLLPITLVEQQKIVPLDLIDQEIRLGLVHPESSEALASINRYVLGYRLKFFGITEEQFKMWSSQLKAQTSSTVEKAPAFASPSNPTKFDVIRWIDQLLVLGMNNRSSDIHIEPSPDHLIVRFRIDGVLQEHPERLPADVAKEVISRLKIISDLDISQQHLPQDGQLKLNVGNVQIMARASSIPVRYGEKIVLRLIRPQGTVVPMAMLAVDRRVLNILNSVTRCKQGLFLVTGPTGSGKTTTLYSMLNAINDIGINVTTLEEPVEMEIMGFNQIEVDRKRGLDFGLALRSVLRQDPNVIMVGEIRDEESAKIVIDASITGHLVLSTLHTNSALDIVPRLSELGVTPATLASGLLGVLSQRLLRSNCKKCLTSRPTLESEKDFFREHLKSAEPPTEINLSTGCPACSNTGYHHRVPIFEIWRNTPNMRRAILEQRSPEALMKIAREDGFESLLECGLKIVLSGLTSLEEVRRVLSSV